MTHTEAVNNLASERYLLDEMTDVERDAFEAHYFECQECADDVRMGGVMREGVQAGFVSAPYVPKVATFAPAHKRVALPAPEAIRQAWYRSTMLPWAVAATLAVMVGYQSQQGRSAEPAEGGAEALAPMVLRPASRGTLPVVSIRGSHIALALDLDAGNATQVSYELRRDDDAVVTTGRASAPPAGSPLLLVIPTFTLKPEQQYILTVRDVSDTPQALSDYRFATAP